MAALAGWGIAVYPELPARVPQHFGPDGVDAYAAKSLGSVFLPVFVQAGVLLVLAGTAVLMLRIRPASELRPGESPGGLSSLVSNRPATRAGAARTARATLALAGWLGLTMAAACAVMWQTGPWQDPPGWYLAVVLAPVLLGTAHLLRVSLKERGSRNGR
nr:DUF1648 domain-containing protein [Streptomyces sp. HNM0574]